MKNWGVPAEVWDLVIRMGEEAERSAEDAALICLLNGLGYTAAIAKSSQALLDAIATVSLSQGDLGQIEDHELEIVREPGRN